MQDHRCKFSKILLTRRAWLAAAGGALGAAAMPRAWGASSSYGAVIYGATPSGVMAAVAAARGGLSVAIVTAGPLGGMCAQGLGWTDLNNPQIIGGLAHSFFLAVGHAYGHSGPAYQFEPHVAQNAFQQMLNAAGVTLISGYLASVGKSGRLISAIQLTDGTVINGRYFVDSSYEGDLMAAAGCNYIVGRESHGAYGESFAGFNICPHRHRAVFHDASGNLIDGVRPAPLLAVGAADLAIPAYTFRLCLSNDPKNSVPFAEPAGYDRTRYLVAADSISDRTIFTPGALPNHKFDLNGDYIGASWNWPSGTYAQRALIWQDHYNYQAGLLYFLANDPSVPKSYRDEINQYGLARDEFTANGNWPTQLYIRAARRLIGAMVLTQHHLQTAARQAAPIGMGSYSFDSHPTQMYAESSEIFIVEGTMGPHDDADVPPYQIPYQALLPLELDNLLVSVCVSATHVAQSSIRVEPQYMIMGEAAGTAVGMAASQNEPMSAVTSSISSQLSKFGSVVSI
jgi:hypothetical protein